MKSYTKASLIFLIILSLLGACKKDQTNSGCITVNITTPIVNQNITFTDCANGAISAAWDFGDGTTGSGIIVTKTYSAIGSYTVTLISTTTGGQTTTTKKTIVISSLQNATYTYTSACNAIRMGDTVRFHASPGATSYHWDFGDGTTGTDSGTSHIFSQFGNYTVRLTMTNALGTDSSSQSLYVGTILTGTFSNGTTGIAATFSSPTGVNSIILQHYPYYPNSVTGTFNGNTFIFPSQNVYNSLTGNITVRGQGVLIPSSCNSGTLYIIDTVTGSSGTNIVRDTLSN